MFRRKGQNELHEELLIQVIELLNIEVGNYIYKKGYQYDLRPHIEGYGGIDFYIFDKDFAYKNKYDFIKFNDYYLDTKTNLAIDDLAMIGHYHYEDLLWLIMNFNSEKEKMIKKVDNYIKWKKNFKNDKVD